MGPVSLYRVLNLKWNCNLEEIVNIVVVFVVVAGQSISRRSIFLVDPFPDGLPVQASESVIHNEDLSSKHQL